jgi:hypothetical protein
MKKIAFVSLLLISGLFSLQYSLISNGGWSPLKNSNAEQNAFPARAYHHFEVIYVYPGDTATRQDNYLKLLL